MFEYPPCEAAEIYTGRASPPAAGFTLVGIIEFGWKLGPHHKHIKTAAGPPPASEQSSGAEQMEQIAGYRTLSKAETDLINAVKEDAIIIGELIERLENFGGEGEIDKRWLAIGKTQLQQGFMAVVRSIAQPTTF